MERRNERRQGIAKGGVPKQEGVTVIWERALLGDDHFLVRAVVSVAVLRVSVNANREAT